MNKFVYKNTNIIESQFNFNKLQESIAFDGEVMLSSTIAVPKNISENKIIVCILDLSLGHEDDPITLHVKSQSIFEIQELANKDELHKDAKEKCLPKAGQELSERIKEITRLHIGKPISIPIPKDLEGA